MWGWKFVPTYYLPRFSSHLAPTACRIRKILARVTIIIVIESLAVSTCLRRRPLRAAIICCLTVLQCHLLWVAMFHQHPLTAFAGGASTAVSQGSSQPRPPVTTELTCTVCQMVRQSLGLSVTASPALHAAVSVSRLLPFCPGDYHSYQSIVMLGRAPPVS
jgi:hypothetical protein